MGDEERGQLAAARWGITSTLLAWALGSLVLALDVDLQSDLLRGSELSEGGKLTLVLGGVVCLAVAALIWRDSNPARVEARLRRLQDRLP